ncbi:hypothetical protein MUA33_04885 [Staphylococcus delphini]|uniref:hypothetical protein n=1 Tax=Staphylococcus delphini TaxID=53344 RepID=UPI0021D0D547|nr:hypothetical protein [Staphylococcus delphini]UXS30121.1 hypothetical protein MUA33_04885 [Staphylococcus delphini]UXS37790.1 hypothetical protein MUA34_05120 [Staphylococcus delphini]UXS45271.1 hypothetical protein MUA39_05245 [Staphylococcus delphini]UXV45891.1 hypothetical protein MUA63_05210 [Staphylococcus delphini]
MIRGLIEKVEDVALRAIIAYDEQLSKVIAQIESDSETRKLIKKTFITMIVGGISGYILIRLGMK